jgi:hypothetical protein
VSMLQAELARNCYDSQQRSAAFLSKVSKLAVAAHPSFCLLHTKRKGGQDMKLIIHFEMVPRVITAWSYTSTHSYAFMVCCIINMDSFYFGHPTVLWSSLMITSNTTEFYCIR